MSDAERSARESIAARGDVSRETFERFEAFVALLTRWNKKINLVSKADIAVIWSRHVADSLELAPELPTEGLWTDLGSGGGFPAIPLAILSSARGDSLSFRLIESDRRKGVFLREAARMLNLPVSVETCRIEDCQPQGEKILSARALASVDRLLCLIEPFHGSQIPLALLKGESVHQELTDAARNWHMRYQSRRTTTTSRGSIVLMQGYRRVSSAGTGEP